MGSLFLILPVTAFDCWLAATTGRRQIVKWSGEKNWLRLSLVAVAALLLAAFFAFLAAYKANDQLRVQGFPIPAIFFHLDGKVWARTAPQPPLSSACVAVNFLTGLVAPFFPIKIAEFLKTVKSEIK